ncbi:hypothetical protein Mapa_005729 [Marchantia paleacea]|nr:hypothetical protein Mapa_005729 [Marchantia paleacea]
MKGSQKKEMPWFLMKTYRIVDKEETNDIISWSRDNKSFIVWSPITFAEELLPKHFKHNRFSSFIRQLNQYGFRKVDPDRFEFAHEKFVRFQPHILREIVRRKPEHRPRSHRGHGTQQQTDVRNPSVEVGHFGLHEEIERFKRDKNILLNEVVKLRHHQQSNERIMQFTNQRLQRTEQREQQMISFVAKAVENPEVFAQLLLRQNQHNILVEKRGALTGHGNCNSSLEQSGLKVYKLFRSGCTFGRGYQRRGVQERSSRFIN